MTWQDLLLDEDARRIAARLDREVYSDPSTEKIDVAAADEAIKRLYRCIGKAAPIILYFSSPAMCELAANLNRRSLDEERSPWPQERIEFENDLDRQLMLQADRWGHLVKDRSSCVPNPLSLEFRSVLDKQCGPFGPYNLEMMAGTLRIDLSSRLERLEGALQKNLGLEALVWLDPMMRPPSPEDDLDRLVGDQLEIDAFALQPLFRSNVFTGHYRNLDILAEEVGEPKGKKAREFFRAWVDVTRHLSWWAPWKGICFVSERPKKIQRDEQGRFHNATGKAIEYSDGWGVGAWHGTRIPHRWLEPEGMPRADDVLILENVEQRRAAIEMLGWRRILNELKAKIVDEHPDPQFGTLLEVRLPDVPGASRFLRVECGTGREFAVCVPPHVRTVRQAQAWLTGLPAAKFAFPSVRT